MTCINENKLFKILDPDLQKAIRSMLSNEKSLIIAELAIVLMSNALINRGKFRITELGRMVTTNLS